jgi:hypothetical protein
MHPPSQENASSSRATTLRDVLITHELRLRNRRAADLRTENEALGLLATCLATSPERLMNTLLQTALRLCNAGSVGISLLEGSGPEAVFRWIAMDGAYLNYVGGTTPRHFSPCGTTLDAGSPQLFYRPARFFTYFERAQPPIVEGLVLPFQVRNEPIATIWIVSHVEETNFDLEDVRVMTTMAAFASVAVQRLDMAEDG